MTIGIHAVAAFRQPVTGVEEYARQIISRLVQRPDAQPHRFVLYAKPPVSSLPFSGLNFTLETLNFPIAWTQVRLSWEMLVNPPHTLFVPAQTLPRILPQRTVVTIHGAEFEHVPQFYPARQRRYLRFATRDAVRRASAIIAVSHATKRDLVERYGVDAQRVHVVHHGIIRADAVRVSADPPFFLFLGRLTLQKNVDGVVRAFSLFKQRTKFPHKLILAGAQGFGYRRIQEAIRESSSRDDIVTPGYVADHIRAQLLSGATALVFPSWAEGFGLPILEAQASGVPVVTSNVTAMPEIAGEGALFVPPGDDEALAHALQSVSADAALARDLVAKGYQNVQRFSWDRAAEETLAILTSKK